MSSIPPALRQGQQIPEKLNQRGPHSPPSKREFSSIIKSSSKSEIDALRKCEAANPRTPHVEADLRSEESPPHNVTETVPQPPTPTIQPDLHDRNTLEGNDEAFKGAHGAGVEPQFDFGDPLVRSLSPVVIGGEENRSKPLAAEVAGDLQSLLNRMVRRVAFGGDRRKGTARIELGGENGQTGVLIVHTEQREVSVELELPPGSALGDLQARITERLERRGLKVRSFEHR